MFQSCTRSRRNNQSGEGLDKQRKESREERAAANANRTASVPRNYASITDPTKRLASEEEIRRRTSGNKAIKTVHSCEASRENNSADSPRDRPRPSPQAVPSLTSKILASHSDKNNYESDLTMCHLPKENGICGPQVKVTEGSDIFNKIERTDGNAIPGLLWEAESSIQRLQLYPLLQGQFQ